MDQSLLITLGILVAVIGLLLTDRVRADLVALLAALALGITGVLTSQETFSGFSRSAVITIVAIFVLAEGLERTGITDRIGRLLLRLAGDHESRLVVIVMLFGAGLSLFMNNIAAAAVLLPAVSGAVRRAGANPSHLLLPLAYATVLGGMATLFTTTNIVVSSLLRDRGLAGFGVLDFAPVGLPVVAAGIAYMALWGRHRLPAQSTAERLQALPPVDSDLAQVYDLGERLFQARIPAGSYLVGRPLADSTFRPVYGLTLVAVERDGQEILSPTPDMILEQGDILLLKGRLEEFRRRDIPPYLEILPWREWHEQDLESPAVGLVEVALAPRSSLIGQTLRSAHFREKYGMTALAIWRGDRPIRTGLADRPLQFGDGLLLHGPRDRLPSLRGEPAIIVLAEGREDVAPVQGKGWLAVAIMGLSILLAAVTDLPVGEVMLGGALAVVLAGVLTMDQAYQSIDWRTVFLIAGMLPIGIALTKTGAATLLADYLVALLGPLGPLALLAGLYVVTVLLAQVMNGAAAAALLAPIAIQAAQQTGADPRAFAMAIALATSMAFLTPLGHPVNVLVMGPGGYHFRDYSKVGLPLVVILFVVVMLLLPLFWPLQPG